MGCERVEHDVRLNVCVYEWAALIVEYRVIPYRTLVEPRMTSLLFVLTEDKSFVKQQMVRSDELCEKIVFL